MVGGLYEFLSYPLKQYDDNKSGIPSIYKTLFIAQFDAAARTHGG